MLHRYMCDALDELRKLYETRNFSPMLGLIEEIQSMGNRMESRIHQVHDWEEYDKEIKEKLAKVKELRAEIEKLEAGIEKTTGKKKKKKEFWEE
jgi:peptidoglycan hydrolase CwlO-like protein